MQKTAIIFSGQSSQYTGMGSELLSLFPNLGYIYEVGSEVLGFDLKQACFFADEDKLKQTELAQPAIFATSILSYETVKSLGIKPHMVAGHSLGEYAAMVASEMLSLEDGFKILKARAAAMSRCAAAQAAPSAMCAVMGALPEEIKAVCDSVSGYVLPVNFNSAAQTVIAGEEAAVLSAMEQFTQIGKRTVKLAVSAAFHSKLMQSAADEFVEVIKDFKFSPPNVDFYSNLYGKKLTDFSDMVTYLCKHLVSPVLFTAEQQAMRDAGAELFIECGPNKVLTGLVKKTLTGVTALNVENEKSFSKLKETLKDIAF